MALELILGCMFASKSTELIKRANRYKSIGKKILAINCAINKRYNTNKISTHDNNTLDCAIVQKLSEIFETDNNKVLYYNADVILIEELQFFKDAFQFVTRAVDKDKKIVICAGLDGDYKREPFPVISQLIPHADKTIKLTAFCKICSDGTPAIFTKKINTISKTNMQIFVGGKNMYIPVCRNHYLL